jgi:endonuclease YncB( thermonuclease family)
VRAVAALLLLVLSSGGVLADEGSLSGVTKVRGPDMLVLTGTRIRLSGVLPPSEDSRCGGESCADLAAKALAEVTAGGPVTCVKERRLGHGYFLGHCRTAADADPALALIERGLLQVEPATASPDYREAAEAAKAARLGLWAD